MHCVIETPTFARQAAALGLTEDERHAIITEIAENPRAGVLISGTGGARKIRFADPAKGKGKSGGYRVITYSAADDVPVFLLDIYSKGERIDLSQAERNELKGILKSLADDYRANAQRKLKPLKAGEIK